MVHRVILGAIERFIGVLIEHYAGNFPLWISPIQVKVLNVTDSQADYVNKVCTELREQGRITSYNVCYTKLLRFT